MPLTAEQQAEIDLMHRKMRVVETLIMSFVAIVLALIVLAVAGGIWRLFYCTHGEHRTVLTNNTDTVIVVLYSVPQRNKPPRMKRLDILPGEKGEVPHLLERDIQVCFEEHCGMYHAGSIPDHYTFQRDRFGPDLRKTVHMTVEADQCLYLVPVEAPPNRRAAEQPSGFPICGLPSSDYSHFY